MRWLIILHCSGYSDIEPTKLVLYHLSRNINKKQSLYLILCGPTRKSIIYLLKITHQNIEILKEEKAKGHSSTFPIIQKFISILKTQNVKINALGFSGHSSSFVLGPWKRYKVAFLSLDEFNTIITSLNKIKLVLFDSCQMGSMANLCQLAHLSPTVKYVIASPGLHPYESFLHLKELFLSTTKQKKIKNYALQLVKKWHLMSKEDKDRCCLLFDLKKVKKLQHEIKNNWKDLIFDKRSQLDHTDANLYDLWTAARNLPKLQQKIEKCVCNWTEFTDKKHCNECKRVRGMSVEIKIPKKFQDHFHSNKWVNFLNT